MPQLQECPYFRGCNVRLLVGMHFIPELNIHFKQGVHRFRITVFHSWCLFFCLSVERERPCNQLVVQWFTWLLGGYLEVWHILLKSHNIIQLLSAM